MAKSRTKPKPPIEQINLLTSETFDRAAAAPQVSPVAPLPVDHGEPLAFVAAPARDQSDFGAWLMQQHSHRREWVAGLARTAKGDTRFPRQGSVEDVRKYLTGLGADGDAFEALDDAEMDWLAR